MVSNFRLNTESLAKITDGQCFEHNGGCNVHWLPLCDGLEMELKIGLNARHIIAGRNAAGSTTPCFNAQFQPDGNIPWVPASCANALESARLHPIAGVHFY